MGEYSFVIVLIIAVVGIVKIISGIKERDRRAQSHNYIRSANRSNNVMQNQPANRDSVQVANSQGSLSNNQNTTVGPVIYYGNSNHNASDVEFKFMYVLKNGGWRAYVVRQPSYNGRDEALTITHRYRDHDNNMYYICWDTPITQVKDMQNVSKVWADCILEYIATGKRFGPS